jgi:hypothetical protein
MYCNGNIQGLQEAGLKCKFCGRIIIFLCVGLFLCMDSHSLCQQRRTHPAFITVGIPVAFSSGIMQLGNEADHAAPFSTEAKNVYLYLQ